MVDYHVLMISACEQRIALRDETGHLHIARPTVYLPQVGQVFHGGKASPGSCILACPSQGEDLPLVFEAVNVNMHAVKNWMHPIPWERNSHLSRLPPARA